jgi:hypothetical protein
VGLDARHTQAVLHPNHSPSSPLLTRHPPTCGQRQAQRLAREGQRVAPPAPLLGLWLRGLQRLKVDLEQVLQGGGK